MTPFDDERTFAHSRKDDFRTAAWWGVAEIEQSPMPAECENLPDHADFASAVISARALTPEQAVH